MAAVYPKFVNGGLIGAIKGANFNSTSDQAITIVGGGRTWIPCTYSFSAPSKTFSSSVGGLYTGASKTGTTLLSAGTTYSFTAGTAEYLNKATGLKLVTASTIYFSLSTANGSAATANVLIFGQFSPSKTNDQNGYLSSINTPSLTNVKLTRTIVVAGKALNFNTTSDQALQIKNMGRKHAWVTCNIFNGTGSFSTAAGGMYSGASKTGTTYLSSGTSYSSLVPGTADSMLVAMSSNSSVVQASAVLCYFSLTTAQGSAATADLVVDSRIQW